MTMEKAEIVTRHRKLVPKVDTKVFPYNNSTAINITMQFSKDLSPQAKVSLRQVIKHMTEDGFMFSERRQRDGDAGRKVQGVPSADDQRFLCWNQGVAFGVCLRKFSVSHKKGRTSVKGHSI